MQLTKVLPENFSAQPRWRFWEIMAMVAFSLSMLVSLIYGISLQEKLKVISILVALSSASWLFGSLIGFLFGVPRLQSSRNEGDGNVDPDTYIPNTNLEQISDWLTKIIIGASLVQIDEISQGLYNISTQIGGMLNAPAAAAVVGSLILFNMCAGLMWGYLWCSLRIFREMASLFVNRGR